MLRTSIVAASLIALAATACSADAAISKPHDASCQKWEKREVVKNYWLKRQKSEVWYCVSGETKDHTTSVGSSFKGSVASSTPEKTPSADEGSPSDTPSDTPSDGTPGKGNNGKGTPNGGKTDGGDPPGGGNTGNDGEG